MDIICDSSSIITLAENCLLFLLENFSRNGTRFYIPVGVRKEIIDVPLSTRRFKFEAIKAMETVDRGWLNVIDLPEKHEEVRQKANKIMECANSLFVVKNRPMRVLQYGEAEALALAKILGIDTILIDEKTTRLLIEDPQVMRHNIEGKVEEKVEVHDDSLKRLLQEIEGLRVIRSVEMVMVAFERGYLDRFFCEKHKLNVDVRKETVLGILYALKDSGCAITEKEIKDYQGLES